MKAAGVAGWGMVLFIAEMERDGWEGTWSSGTGISAAARGEPTANGFCRGQVPGDAESYNPTRRSPGSSRSQQTVLGRNLAAHPQKGTA